MRFDWLDVGPRHCLSRAVLAAGWLERPDHLMQERKLTRNLPLEHALS